MDDQWSVLKSLFANDATELSIAHRRALMPSGGPGSDWETPRVAASADSLQHSASKRPPRSPRTCLGSIAPVTMAGACWVVTSADSRFWSILTCFIASLREVALYEAQIAIIDYGLEPWQREKLGELGITVVAPHGRYALVIDRYLTLAEYFRNNAEDTILYFDADIWFADSIGEIFANHSILTGKLGAAKDVWNCDYYLKCSDPAVHPSVERALAENIRDYGQTLQAGFIAGSARAWARYANLLTALLDEGFARDQWGTDALALNLYAALYARHFALLPITYNAPPLWGVVREGTRFFATKFDTDSLYRQAHGRIPVRAIHCTSAVRHRTDLGLYFGDVYPEILEQWKLRLAHR